MAWLQERLHDLIQWPLNLVRDFPVRLVRFLASLLRPWDLRPFGWRSHSIACGFFDLLGGPEIAQFLMHLVMPTSPLTDEERMAVVSVLGPRALRVDDIRIAQGGLLTWIFQRNGNRAFALWHTIHLPHSGKHKRGRLDLLVHESVHVFQYEQVGTVYIGEAVAAQMQLGRGAYDYGKFEGLLEAWATGRLYQTFNREQQAQIAQHYYARRQKGHDVSAYRPYIAALRRGAF